MEESAPGAMAIGIDFGTTALRVAVYRDEHGSAEMLHIGTDNGAEIPALVAISTSSGAVEAVGSAATRRLMGRPQDCVYDIRRILGRRNDADSSCHSGRPFKSAATSGTIGGDGTRRQQIATASLASDAKEPLGTAEEATIAVISHTLTRAAKHLNGKIGCVGITIPNGYDQIQRKALRNAAIAAGAEECQLVTETVATALAYAFTYPPPQTLNMMVVHFGAGSLDVSVIRARAGHLRVLGSAANSNLGGRDMDDRLFSYAERKIRAAYKVDCATSPKRRQALLQVCEQMKIELVECAAGRNDEHPVTIVRDIERVIGVEDARLEINETTFRAMCMGFATKAANIAKEAIRTAHLDVGDIDLLLLTGKTNQIAIVQESIIKLFPADKRPRVEYLHNGNVLAAQGAALRVACCSQAHDGGGTDDTGRRKWTVEETTSSCMGVMLGRFQRQLLPENTPYPVTRSMRLRASANNAHEVGQIYEKGGGGPCNSTRYTLGQFPLWHENGSDASCELLFEVDSSGILRVMRPADAGLEVMFECPVCYSECDRAEAITCYQRNRRYTDVLDPMASEDEGDQPTSPSVHFFCVRCVRGLAQSATTDSPLFAGGIGFPCMEDGCQQPILFSSCHSIIDDDVLRKLHDRGFEENLASTNLTNLERCSKCNFLVEMDIPAEVERRFLCLQCEFSQCRLCQRHWTAVHEELTCAEMDERDQQETHDREARRIEARMSEVVIRKCSNCGLAFVKADGCNKMTCRCGRTKCYLCQVEGVAYDHFGDAKCPLYGDAQVLDTAALHQIVNDAAAIGVRVAAP